MAQDNKLLGQFNLEDISPAPRGVPQIEVTFDIDANGIVNVLAKDKASGKEQKITIQSSGGLTEEDIQRAVREAEEHAAEDRKRRELAEARNAADAVMFQAEKALKDAAARADSAEYKAVEAAIAALKTVVEGENASDIQAKAEALNSATVKLGEQAAGAEDLPEGHGGDDIIDAEFDEADDGKSAKSN